MKVIRQDAQALVLRDWSWGVLVGIGLVMALCLLMAWGYFRAGVTNGGVIMCGIAALLLIPLYSFARWTSVWFDRKSGIIRVTEIGLLLFRITRHPMEGLVGATMETHVIRDNPASHDGERNWRRRNRNVRTWRPVLTYADGHRVPMLEAYGEQIRAGAAASAVNAWVNRPVPN